jgi:hypothetical protein
MTLNIIDHLSEAFFTATLFLMKKILTLIFCFIFEGRKILTLIKIKIKVNYILYVELEFER